MPIKVDPVSFKNRPQTMIWVGVGKTPTTYRDGTVIYPFLTPQEAVDWAATQPDISFHVFVSPGVYGDLTIPAGKTFVFETSTDYYGANINNLVVTATTGGPFVVTFKNFTINGTVDFVGASGDNVILTLGESTLVGGNITNSGAVNATLISNGSSQPNSGYPGNIFSGTIDLGSTGNLVGANSRFFLALTASTFRLSKCDLPISITAYGNDVRIDGSGWLSSNSTITFIASGTVVFDSASAINFGLTGGDIVSGDAITEGAGPQLLRADVDLNPLDGVVSTTAYHVTSSADLDDKDVIGVVYPNVLANKLALIWQSGELIPGVGLPTDVYYRYRVTGGYVNFPTTQILGNGDGTNFYVNIQPTPREQIVLSMLNPSGIWFPGEYAGPTANSISSPFLNVGFARIPKGGTLTNFKLTQASPSGSTVTNLQVYIAPVGIPSLFAFSGLSLGVVAGDYISTDNVSQLSVFEDDIIAIYNAEFFGWTPNALTITADLLLN